MNARALVYPIGLQHERNVTDTHLCLHIKEEEEGFKGEYATAPPESSKLAEVEYPRQPNGGLVRRFDSLAQEQRLRDAPRIVSFISSIVVSR